MSVVDRGGWVSAGRARRLLLRVLLVLGGALVVTGIGWLVGTASASAEVLPTVPVPPLSAVTDVVPAPALPAAVPATLPTPALSGSSLGQVEQQVHQAVSGVGDRVTPATAPALPITVPLTITSAEPVNTPPVTETAGATPVPAAAGARPQTVVSHRHPVGTAAHVRPRTTDTAHVGAPQHHMPALPPAGSSGSSESSDANVHTTGGSAGGAGGAQYPFVTLVGAAPHAVGRPTTPRLPVAPGQQPGTSPD